jgi:hypothetical protein
MTTYGGKRNKFGTDSMETISFLGTVTDFKRMLKFKTKFTLNKYGLGMVMSRTCVKPGV